MLPRTWDLLSHARNRFDMNTVVQASETRVGALSRLRHLLLLTPESWCKRRHLRAGLGFALMVCSAVSGAKWYSWLEHQGVGFYVPVLWTVGGLLIFVLGPKKIDLLAYCATAYFVLGSIGTILGRAPNLPTALEVTVLPGTAALFLSYIEVRRARRSR